MSLSKQSCIELMDMKCTIYESHLSCATFPGFNQGIVFVEDGSFLVRYHGNLSDILPYKKYQCLCTHIRSAIKQKNKIRRDSKSRIPFEIKLLMPKHTQSTQYSRCKNFNISLAAHNAEYIYRTNEQKLNELYRNRVLIQKHRSKRTMNCRLDAIITMHFN